MRTTIDLPETLMEEVQRVSHAASRREALVTALEDYLRRKRIQEIISAAGTMDLDIDVRALRRADRRPLRDAD